MKNPSLKSLLIIATILQIIWGLVPSASKMVISEIPVELYIALRWTISGCIFLAFILFTSKWRGIIKKEMLWVSLLGICGYALASFGTLYGLKIGGVSNFALMGAFNPIIISVISILFLKEKPAKLFYLALPLCIFGLVLLILGKHQISSWKIALSSSAFIIGAAFLDSIVFVFSKKFKIHFNSLQYLAITQLSAAVFMWMLQAGFYKQFDKIQDLSFQGCAAAIFVSIVACVLCYTILYWLLNYLDGHRLALFDGIHTVSATLFGVIFFGEILNSFMIFGGALLLLGLVLGNLPNGDKKLS